MAIEKGLTPLITSQAIAHDGVAVTSGWVDITEKQAFTSHMQITNGDPTPGTNRIELKVEVADDAGGTNASEVYFHTTTVDVDAVSSRRHVHDITDRYVRVSFTNPLANTADVTGKAWGHSVDALG